MSYSVDWTPQALSQLGALWMHYAAHQRAITAAQARIDRSLAADPLRFGTVLSEGLYVINVHPLRAAYEVEDVNRRVKVVSVSWLP